MDRPERALITGASSGIGLAFARALAERGHDLVLVARGRERLEEVADEIRAGAGVEVQVVAQDLSEPDAAAVLASKVSAREVDLLVNNAGFGDFGRFADQDRARVLGMINLNVAAVTDLCHRFAPLMRERGSGAMVNVASIQAFMAVPYFAVYAATKAYLLSFSEALAVELEPHGVHVMALCPGTTTTSFQASAGAGSAERMPGTKMTPEQVVEHALKALGKRTVTAIPGASNKVAALSRRLVSRSFYARVMAKLLGEEVDRQPS